MVLFFNFVIKYKISPINKKIYQKRIINRMIFIIRNIIAPITRNIVARNRTISKAKIRDNRLYLLIYSIIYYCDFKKQIILDQKMGGRWGTED